MCIRESLSGGLGDGLSDRAVESSREAQGDVVFERVDAIGCDRFLLGRCQDMVVYGLSGEPLAAAAAFDLFLRPALLARRGLGARVWDLSLIPSSLFPPRGKRKLLPALWQV